MPRLNSKGNRKPISHVSEANTPSQSLSARSSSWSLPLELSLQILALLPHRDLRSFSLCCRLIYTICRSHHLYSAIRIGNSYDEAFLYPKPDLLSLATKPDRFTKVYSRSTNVIIYDVDQIERFNIGPLIREAFVGIGHCRLDEEALRRFLRLCTHLKSLHIIGHTPPERPLAPSTVMMDIRNIASTMKLEQLEFSWVWQGKYSTILDASSDGPKGLKKLKMTLKCDAYSKLPIPLNMLPRMVKRAAANSIDTITELDLSCAYGPQRGLRGTEVDLTCFAGMPLRVFRYRTSPEKNITNGNLHTICNLFPKLEELYLDENVPRIFWRTKTEEVNLENLAKLTECKTLTLSHRFTPADWSEFTTWTEYDAFISLLPTERSFAFFGRELLSRVEATQRIAETMGNLERITWLDHARLPQTKRSQTEGYPMEDDGEGRHLADIVRGRVEEGTGVKLEWQYKYWWDNVITGQFGPDSKGRDLESWWNAIYKESRKRAVEKGELDDGRA